MRFHDGLLSIESRGETWAELLAALQREAGFAIHVREFPLEGPVTVSFSGLPPERALRRLFGPSASFLWLYSARPAPGASVALAEVWVVGSGRPAGAEHSAVSLRPGGRGERGNVDELEERLALIEALASDNPQQAVPILTALLTDPDLRIRGVATEALGSLGDQSAVEGLSKILASDPAWPVRAAAAEALGEIASPRALGALRHALGDKDDDVRAATVGALGRIPVTLAADLLRSALKDPVKDVREAAAKALADLEKKGVR